MSMFKQAVKHESKLRMSIAGPSGSGKTYSALSIATALAEGKPIAVVDTEHGSAAKYSDIFKFDVLEMQPPYHPDRFVEAIRDAAKAGYSVVILDSLTHAWSGSGGVLDIVDEETKRKGGNSYVAWKEGTAVQNRLVEAIIASGVHVISTMRSKQDYAQEKDEKGKTVVKKLGMAPQQRDGFEYEFDVVLDMNIDNDAVVGKTRCPALNGRVFRKPGADVASILKIWLSGAPAPERKVEQKSEQAGATVADSQSMGERQPGATSDPLPVYETWANSDAAKQWAVDVGAVADIAAASAELQRVADDNVGGKITRANAAIAMRLYHDHIQALLLKKVSAPSEPVKELAF